MTYPHERKRSRLPHLHEVPPGRRLLQRAGLVIVAGMLVVLAAAAVLAVAGAWS